MTTSATRLLVTVLALATGSMAACVTDEDDAHDRTGGAIPTLAGTEYAVPHGSATELLGLGEPLALEGGPCECATEACVADYVREQLGCGVCISVACPDGRRVGGCLPC